MTPTIYFCYIIATNLDLIQIFYVSLDSGHGFAFPRFAKLLHFSALIMLSISWTSMILVPCKNI